MPGPSTGLTRVTISSPQRRVDVALPDGVPLAELLPELLEHAGEAMADNGERHGGWALRRADGTALSPGAALTTQGVRDGAVLHLVPARAEWPELEYDDVVEAIAAGARRYGVGWSGRASRVTALAVAGVALAAGLWAVLRSGPEWTVPALAALGVAAVLLLAGVVSSRAYGDVVAGAALCAYAMPYGFVGGLVLLAGSAPLSQVKAWHLLDGAVALLVTALLGAVGAAYALRLFVAGATAAVLGVFAGLLGFFAEASGAAAVVLTLLVTGIAAVPLLAIRFGKLPMPVVTLPSDTASCAASGWQRWCPRRSWCARPASPAGCSWASQRPRSCCAPGCSSPSGTGCRCSPPALAATACSPWRCSAGIRPTPTWRSSPAWSSRRCWWPPPAPGTPAAPRRRTWAGPPTCSTRSAWSRWCPLRARCSTCSAWRRA